MGRAERTAIEPLRVAASARSLGPHPSSPRASGPLELAAWLARPAARPVGARASVSRAGGSRLARRRSRPSAPRGRRVDRARRASDAPGAGPSRARAIGRCGLRRAGCRSLAARHAPALPRRRGGRSLASGAPSVESIVMERYYVTTPIYYVNSTPHIGHAYTTIAADILARNRRQRGAETFFLTGVDEHAAKVARVAAEQGLSPQEYADQIAVVWRELPERLNASNDFFIRTSDDEHKRFVQGFLQRLYDNGHVYQDVYAGLYCVGCEAFKSGGRPRRREVPRARRGARVDRGAQLVLPALVLRGAAARALRARRLRPARLPGERGAELHRGRPAGLLDQPGGPDLGDPDPVGSGFGRLRLGRRARQLPQRPHLRATGRGPGRDVLARRCGTCSPRTSSASTASTGRRCCSAAGYEPPRQLFVHGYLLLDDRKISKSLGNVVDPLDLIDVYGADPVRFWCARAVSFGQDGAASIVGIHERYERELGNDLGNLLSRTTAMVARYRDGKLRAVPSPDGAVAAALEPLGGDVADRLDAFDVTGALERIWEVVRALNREVEIDRAVAAREGRGARRRPRPRPLRPRRRPARGRRRARRLRPRRRPRRSSPRCASRRPSTGRWSRTG